MTVRNYVDNAAQVKVVGSITSGATTFQVSSSTGFPAVPFVATLGLGTASAEQVLVTAVVSTNWTVTRNYNGQGSYSHPDGETVDHTAIAKDYQEANAHVNATSGVHGVSGTLVGTTDTQTLSGKTLSNPTVTGTVTATGATISGATVSGGTLSGTIGGTAAVTTASVSTGTVSASGASTAASFTASGDGAVTGVITPKQYTNEAAATAALGTPTVGATVWLTAPTTAGAAAGPFCWNGSAWVPATVAGEYDSGWLNVTGIASGWTIPGGQVAQMRQIGNRVMGRGYLTNSSFSGGYTTIANVPTGVGGSTAYIPGWAANTNSSATRSLQVNGTLIQAYSAALSTAWMPLSVINYLTD